MEGLNMPNEIAAWDLHFSGPVLDFGLCGYAEAEFNRLLANGDAMIATNGTRLIKFDRMGQPVWVREIRKENENG
jgi:hypothetical protein